MPLRPFLRRAFPHRVSARRLWALGLAGILALPAPLTGPVDAAGRVIAGPARVIDGDTIQIGATHIRLIGIDTPEAAETCKSPSGVVWRCGSYATHWLRQRLEGLRVECLDEGRDRYARTLAHCRVDGRDLGADLTRAGVARAYRRYSTEYVPAEEAARRAGLGLWADRPQVPAQFLARAVDAGPKDCQIKGNISKSGMIYHVPGSRSYNRTRIDTSRGERWFCSEGEARAAGWRAPRG